MKRALGILAVKVAEEPTADRVVLTALLRHRYFGRNGCGFSGSD